MQKLIMYSNFDAKLRNVCNEPKVIFVHEELAGQSDCAQNKDQNVNMCEFNRGVCVCKKFGNIESADLIPYKSYLVNKFGYYNYRFVSLEVDSLIQEKYLKCLEQNLKKLGQPVQILNEVYLCASERQHN